MRIIINVDEKTGAQIEEASEKLGLKKGDWVKMACETFLGNSGGYSHDDKAGSRALSSVYSEDDIESRDHEIQNLREEIELQKDLKDTYAKLISEKDQRIDDLKESVSRIEAMSITTTDQIASSKDERINDLNHMIEHLQAQAAAHSVALQSAIKPALENSRQEIEEESVDMIQKPKWMFWR
ncbi:chromosome segregation ATPase [Methanomicrobium sp. W14]|uniref:hypothetical protein n=1 Tax=Methanomicrobium sp. W14 TaxID=2817839 RepID=UPI001AE19AF4|nr:hypothetical protein [Methanomicrobium sp. W14]MBP2133503.1 chromosome segregation ATPase [Methanomicrobium sp. W14]